MARTLQQSRGKGRGRGLRGNSLSAYDSFRNRPESDSSIMNRRYRSFRELVTAEKEEGTQNEKITTSPPRKRRKVDPSTTETQFRIIPTEIFRDKILPFCPKSSFRLVSKQINEALMGNEQFLKAYLWLSLNGSWFREDFIEDRYAVLNETCELGLTLDAMQRICNWEDDEAKKLFIDECFWLFRRLQQLKQIDEEWSPIYLSASFLSGTPYPIRPIVIDLDEALEQTTFITNNNPDNIDMEYFHDLESSDLEKSICFKGLSRIVRFPRYELKIQGTGEYDEHWEEMLELDNMVKREFCSEKIPEIVEAHKELKANLEQRYEDNCVVKLCYELSEGRDLWVQVGVRKIGGRRFLMGIAIERYDY